MHLLALSDTPKEFDISILQQSLGGNNEIKVTIRWNTVRKLASQGAKKVVLTGAAFDGKYGVLLYNSETDSFRMYEQEKIDAIFHGTGDIFSSTFTGALMRGMSEEDSAAAAADFTAECIRITKQSSDANWYGVDFERAIPYLLNRLS